MYFNLLFFTIDGRRGFPVMFVVTETNFKGKTFVTPKEGI